MHFPSIYSAKYKFLRHFLRMIEPFVPAHNSQHKYSKLYKIYRFLGGAERVVARRYDGKEMLLTPPDFVRYLHGADHKRFGSSNFYPLMYQFAKPGSVVIDVGAGCGDEAIDLSQLVGEKGTVYSFEPEPNAFYALQSNVELNKLLNVYSINAALGSEDGELKFSDRVAGWTVNRDKDNKTVKVIKLDDYYLEHIHPKPVSLLKIDTDGFDLDVLEGAQQLLHNNPDCKIIMEFLPSINYSGKKGRDVLQFLHTQGYQVGRIQPSIVPIENDDDIDFTLTHFNDKRHQICHDLVLQKKG